MQTNSRPRTPGEWAPPPPVVVEQKRSTPPPLPTFGRSAEAEFDATLGSLVEQFAALPPADFGEPPDLALVEPRRMRTREVLWWGVGSLVLGAALAGAGLAGFHLLRSKPVAVPVAVTAPRPEVPIVINTPAAQPVVEPLVDEKMPETTALDDPAPAAVTEAAVTPQPVKRVVRRAVKGTVRAKPGLAPVVEHAAAPAGAEDNNAGWEDPYK